MIHIIGYIYSTLRGNWKLFYRNCMNMQYYCPCFYEFYALLKYIKMSETSMPSCWVAVCPLRERCIEQLNTNGYLSLGRWSWTIKIEGCYPSSCSSNNISLQCGSSFQRSPWVDYFLSFIYRGQKRKKRKKKKKGKLIGGVWMYFGSGICSYNSPKIILIWFVSLSFA